MLKEPGQETASKPMPHCRATVVPAHQFHQSGAAATVGGGSFPNRAVVISLHGPLLAPDDCELGTRVRDVLRSAGRNVVLDLGGVSSIDAAGVGELVRAYNMTTAVGGVLRVANVKQRVRELLQLAGLFDLMSRGPVDIRARA